MVYLQIFSGDENHEYILNGNKLEYSGGRLEWAHNDISSKEGGISRGECWTTGGTLIIELVPSIRQPATNNTVVYYGQHVVGIGQKLVNWESDGHIRLDLAISVIKRNDKKQLKAKDIPVHDYLNYEIMKITDIEPRVPDSYKGYYIWISRDRLSADLSVSGTTILIEPGNGLCFSDKSKPIEQNLHKRHIYSVSPHHYEPPDEIPLPILSGPGTYDITISDATLMAAKEWGAKYEVFTKYAPVTAPSFTFTAKSIFINDPTINQALIAETEPSSGVEYYNGQYPTNHQISITLTAPYLDPAWFDAIGSKVYAVVYVMLTGNKNAAFVDPKHCRRWYAYLQTAQDANNKAEMNGIFQSPALLFSEGITAPVQADKLGGNFEFANDYEYLIKEGWDRPDQKTITITMPSDGDRPLQFAALLFRVVPKGDGSTTYTIDPTCRTAIETHIGIYGKDKNNPLTQLKTIKAVTPTEAEITWNMSTYTASNPLFVDITRTIKSKFLVDDGTQVGFDLIKINIDNTQQTLTFPQRFPLGTETSQKYEPFFPLDEADHTVGTKYKIRVNLYSKDGALLDFTHDIPGEIEVKGENVISFGSITPLFGTLTPQFTVTGFKMDSAPPDAQYLYSLTVYNSETMAVIGTRPYSDTAISPREFQQPWTPDAFTLPAVGKYRVMFEVWNTQSPQPATDIAIASSSIEYQIDSRIENAQIKDTYTANDKRKKRGLVKTKWSFHAQAIGLGATTYNWSAKLTSATPEPLKEWNFDDIHGDELEFEDTEVIEIPLGDYQIELAVKDAAVPSMVATYTYINTIGGPKAEGTLSNGTLQIYLSDPLAPPNDDATEYRLMREGFTGAIESPWELKNESVVGSASAGVAVWMVHPRTITLRVLVTAHKDNIVAATKELIALLTVNPRSPINLSLWTSDGAQQLTITGYPEVGTPVIEMRESTGAIVAITLNCPRYAWRGSSVSMSGSTTSIDTEIRGNLPPALDIWLSPGNDPNNKKVSQLTIASTKSTPKVIKFKTDTTQSNIKELRVHYDPILQDLAISQEENVQPKRENSAILVANQEGVRLVRDGNTTVAIKNAFHMIDPTSDLSILNLTPGVKNTISTDGKLDKIIITPYYAHWW